MATIRVSSEIGAGTPIADHRLQRLVAYWQSRQAGSNLPAIDDVDPVEFVYAWGYVCLVDVVQDGLRPRFRFRLDGSKLSASTGDWTGRYLDDIDLPEYVGMTMEGYRRNVVDRAALHHLRDLVCDGMPIIYEAVALPLRQSDGVVGRLLVGVIPGRHPGSDLGPEPTNSVDLLLRH